MTHHDQRERADLIEALAAHRGFLRRTVQGITDEQARQRTTPSELCLGGIIKHVSRVERRWAEFVVAGPDAMAFDENSYAQHQESFKMGEGETLEGLLAEYQATAEHTDELVRTVADLDADHPLPQAPWFPPGARRSARRVFVHIIAETAQHAGHADIIREALDGSKTMG